MPWEEFLAEQAETIAEAVRRAQPERHGLSIEHFARAMLQSAQRYAPSARGAQLRAFLLDLRLEDLALAAACAAGSEGAWEEFHRLYRQYLVDAARDAELADQVIAELYGVENARRGIAGFRGRSALKTWLRAIVCQAQVDHHRRQSRLAELETIPVEPGHEERPEEFERRENAEALARSLSLEVDRLPPGEKLLLAWYYVDSLRLAQIARLRRVHESTISRELNEVRKKLRKRVEKRLRSQGFSAARVLECFRCSTDAPIDFAELLAGKKSPAERTY